MKQFVLSALAGAALLGVTAAQTPDADTKAWQEHRTTRVLYAGWPGGSREKAFEPFLKQWFDEVGVIDLEKLTAAAAAGFDVVIADWGSQYGNDGYPAREDRLLTPKVVLGDDFTRPIVAMNFVSTSLRRGHKLDWL